MYPQHKEHIGNSESKVAARNMGLKSLILRNLEGGNPLPPPTKGRNWECCFPSQWVLAPFLKCSEKKHGRSMFSMPKYGTYHSGFCVELHTCTSTKSDKTLVVFKIQVFLHLNTLHAVSPNNLP